jgi:O-antigen ligase
MAFVITAIVYVLFYAKRNIQKAALLASIVLVIIVYVTPFLHQRATSALVGDKSTESRYSLWNTGNKMIKDSPILGKGLLGFKSNFEKYNTDPTQPSINLAHNIFINFWVETGLLGLISFILISLFALYRSWRLGGILGAGITLFLIAIFTHGQVDNPYLKNDLAMIYWMILAFQS